MLVLITIISLICSICGIGENEYDTLLHCSKCGLCVHKACYGVIEAQTPWRCYPCSRNVLFPICKACQSV